MKTTWKYVVLSASIAIALSACGTSDSSANKDRQITNGQNGSNPKSDSTKVSPTEDGAAIDSTLAGETAGGGNSKNATEDISEGTPQGDLPETKKLEVALKGMTQSFPSTLTMSDLGYTFYLIEGFEFTPEEPGKDLIFNKEFPGFNVRIELLPRDANINDLMVNAEETLKIVGDIVPLEIEPVGVTNTPENVKFSYHVSNAEVSRNIIVIEKEGALMRFTLNFPNNEVVKGIAFPFYPMINSVTITK